MALPLSRPARLAVFASGRGSNLQALLHAFPPGGGAAEVALVVSDKADALALQRARAQGCPAIHIPFGHDREGFERRALEQLEAHRIDLVCLAGFMRLLSADFVARLAGRIVNIHPSLLPAFPGLHAPAQALAAGVAETGCTVHFVDAGVDTGPVIAQARVPILPGDTVESLSARIREAEHRLYPETVRRLVRGEARFPLEVKA
jgi:phosphoribosylglycinamide formyltransferase-1